MVRERSPVIAIVPRDKRNGAKDTRVPQRKGRVVAPKNETDGTKFAWNNSDVQESAAKKGKGNREERVRRIEGRKGRQDAGLRSVTHIIFRRPRHALPFVSLASQALNSILKMRY